jgi:growth arrest and DNA-damage-inducible protein
MRVDSMKCAKALTLDIGLAACKAAMFNRSIQTLSSSLKETLTDAKRDGRLTCGIYESGQLLQMSPESIMLCVLPEDQSDDIALHIHFTLIRAFCLENDILVVKVDSVSKMKRMLSDFEDEEFDGHWPTDFNCLLVEYPPHGLSKAEENVLEFGRMTGDLSPRPVVKLDV